MPVTLFSCYSLVLSFPPDDYDDLSGLTSSQLASSEEWLMQFTERYEVVGDLVRQEKAAEPDTRSKQGQSGDEETSK